MRWDDLAVVPLAPVRTTISGNLAALRNHIGDNLAMRTRIDRAGQPLVDLALQPLQFRRRILIAPDQIAHIVGRAGKAAFGNAGIGPGLEAVGEGDVELGHSGVIQICADLCNGSRRSDRMVHGAHGGGAIGQRSTGDDY